jgi:phage terminase large subunit-like protein
MRVWNELDFERKRECRLHLSIIVRRISKYVASGSPGALWTRELIEKSRSDTYPNLRLIIIAVDPAVTANEDSDDTGIVVIGLGVDGHGYVLRDLTCHRLATPPLFTSPMM